VAWTVETLNARVDKELLALPEDMQARFLRIGELMREFGPSGVGMPLTRPLGAKLWELRLSGRAGIGRAIYVATSSQRLVVLHVFVKKTEKTPRQAIATALRRMKEARL
jgi:phage-related protein